MRGEADFVKLGQVAFIQSAELEKNCPSTLTFALKCCSLSDYLEIFRSSRVILVGQEGHFPFNGLEITLISATNQNASSR